MRRARRPERMDDPGLDAVRHRAALRGLARINLVSGCAGALWRALRPLAHRPLRVLDLAAGGGDVAIALARRARRGGAAVTVEGCDRSPFAVRYANERAGGAVRFFECDVLADCPDGYDVYLSSLFLHHLDEAQAVGLLRRMARGSALLVHDLERSRVGLLAAQVGTRFLTRSPVVHADGPQSVRNAYTAAEARDLAARAGLAGAKVHRRWPFRWLLTWRRA